MRILENLGTHPLRRSDKLKRVGGYLINWMISVDYCGDSPFKMQRASCALYGWGFGKWKDRRIRGQALWESEIS